MNRQSMRDDADRKFKVKFNNTNNVYSNINFNDSQKEEDIYYDEVIYYDGGDVNGYGDSKETH